MLLQVVCGSSDGAVAQRCQKDNRKLSIKRTRYSKHFCQTKHHPSHGLIKGLKIKDALLLLYWNTMEFRLAASPVAATMSQAEMEEFSH